MNVRNFSSVAVCLCVAFITVSSHPRRPISKGGNNQRNPSCDPAERYHRETQKCHPIGMKGPCGENMIFVEDKSSKTQGVCECDDHVGCNYWPLIYWQPTDRCYPLFAQGPCRNSEWLVRKTHPRNQGGSRKILGECKRRTCDTAKMGKTFSHQGSCHEIGTQGFCSTPQEHVYFSKGSEVPRCFAKPVTVTTEVCQAAKQGGGTVQHVIIVTPPPVSPIPPPPAASERAVPVSPPLASPASEKMTPLPPLASEDVKPIPPPPGPDNNMTLPNLSGFKKTLANPGQLNCGAGKARSSTGDCLATAQIQ